MIGTTEPPSAGTTGSVRRGRGPGAIPEALRPASNLITGMPPLLMLAFGIVMGAAISFAVGVVVWSVFG